MVVNQPKQPIDRTEEEGYLYNYNDVPWRGHRLLNHDDC